MSSLIQFHYDPLTEFDRLFDDMFNSRFGSSAPSAEVPRRAESFHPKLDLHESEDSVIATFELPGLTSKDVLIDLQQNRLTVCGEYSTSASHEEGGYAVRERRNGKFSRTLQIPFGTKPEDVKAKMENGLLTLTFPKAILEQPQRITIQ